MNYDERQMYFLEQAVAARHNWLQALIDKRDHEVVSGRWSIFVDMLHSAGSSMSEFENYLRVMNPNEYAFAQLVD